MVKGVIAGFQRRVVGPQRRGGRVHRRRRQGFLHGRQHQGVFRVLQPPPERVRRVHGPVQRHGRRDPELQEADRLPRQRHARGRRPGDRHGLRPDDLVGPGDLRPGRAQARFGARRRHHRLPALDASDRGRDVELHLLRDVERLQDEAQGPDLQGGAGPQDGRQVRPQPAGGHRPLRRRRRDRLRRAEDRRRGEEAPARSCSRAGPSTSAASTRSSTDIVWTLHQPVPRLPDQVDRRHPRSRRSSSGTRASWPTATGWRPT